MGVDTLCTLQPPPPTYPPCARRCTQTQPGAADVRWNEVARAAYEAYDAYKAAPTTPLRFQGAMVTGGVDEDRSTYW